ncbi:DUF3043 domain-containing protein [Streptacidiphilus fuscans]|uniref:DUF3043 domain-containing protein n=1 Tax=Streptacidiphilus fuscans TaxID=2789292 RepID=A0A931B4P9_9ACTN|nr:DUF3043 domain-containing protein [Streptacidiphilus fuscans]MBF9071084.1 DUF3043 domain-containing protein [Streptacidiphilus fuscans]
MFRRSSQDAPADAVTLDKSAEAEAAEAAVPSAEAKKGRPTPKRSEAEANRRGRAYVPPDRKASARKARDANRSDRDKTMLALRGEADAKYLPARDRGPVRAFVRDYFDSRFTVLEFFLPFAVVFMVLAFFRSPAAVELIYVLWLAFLVAVVIQMLWLATRLRKELATRFPGQNTKGALAYGIMRSMNLRRMRLPKPAVKRGQRP